MATPLDFFTTSIRQVIASLGVLPQGPILDQIQPPARHADGELDPGTLASHAWLDQLAVVPCEPRVHPAAYAAIGALTGHDPQVIRALAHADVWLRDGVLIDAPLAPEQGDLFGGTAVAELVRRADPSSPLVRVALVARVPLPPGNARPSVRDLAPTMVDPWMGPVNELWSSFVYVSARERQLAELNAPSATLAEAHRTTQHLLEALCDITREPPEVTAQTAERSATLEGRLVPPLAKTPNQAEGMTRLVWFDRDRLLVQTANAVRVVATDGTTHASLAPAGCRLIGVVEGRLAVFHEYFQCTHPAFADEPCFDEEHLALCMQGDLPVDELTVLDLDSQRYLTDVPAGFSATLVSNDQPEELFAERADGSYRRLDVGGDRPRAMAYTNDARFVWIGEPEQGSQILELASLIPHAVPADISLWNVPTRLSLRAGELVERNDDDQTDDDLDEDAEGAAAAVAFDGTRWRVLWPGGVLTNHLGTRPVKLVPTPEGAAFSPDGRHIACMLDRELVVIDASGPRIVSRARLAD